MELLALSVYRRREHAMVQQVGDAFCIEERSTLGRRSLVMQSDLKHSIERGRTPIHHFGRECCPISNTHPKSDRLSLSFLNLDMN